MLVTTHSIFHCVRQLFGYQHSLKYFIKQIFPVLDSDAFEAIVNHSTHTHTHTCELVLLRNMLFVMLCCGMCC